MRLTMGGEPTFVSIGDVDGEEVEYGGGRPEQAPSRGNICRYRDHSPGGLLHFGQGKWCPVNRCRAGLTPVTGAPDGFHCTAMRSGSANRIAIMGSV